jgi:hypothetical protein
VDVDKVDTRKYYKILKCSKYSNHPYSLTTVSENHIESIRGWRNDQVEVLRQDGEISKNNQIKYYENVVWPELNLSEPGRLLFSFFKDSELIGYGGLVHIDWERMSAEMSFLLSTKRMKNDSQYQEDLMNFIAIMKVIAFYELAFKKVVTETYSFRRVTIETLGKAGFVIDDSVDKCKINSKSIFHCLTA